MAVIELTRGIDARVVLVDGTTGAAITGGGTQVEGKQAAGAVVTQNPFSLGFLGTGGTLRYLTGANQLTNTAGNDVAGVGPLVYDTVGAVWNRWRDANSASNTTGTGLAGAGNLVWDGAAWQKLASSTTGEPKIAAGGFDLALPTVTFTRGANTTAYTIGDEVGTSGTAPSTATFARANGFGGVIQGCRAIFSNSPAVVPSLRVLIFSATVTLAGDNAQVALSDGDALLLLGSILLTESQSLVYSAGAVTTTAALALAGAPTEPIRFKCGAAETTLYIAVMTLNAWTPIANSETLQLFFSVEAN